MQKRVCMELLGRRDIAITTWEQWTRPKRGYQWAEGRSAMELAKAWFSQGVLQCPRDLALLFQSASFLNGLILRKGRPEFVTPLPVAGEGRNHDLYLLGSVGTQTVTICIEAKADEPFGDTISHAIQKARKRKPSTGMPARARQLITILMGRDSDPEAEPWSTLRYQLLTGIAGTVLQAGHDAATIALFIVHEFITSKTNDSLHALNTGDLSSFLRVLDPSSQMKPGQFWGPHKVSAQSELQFYVGKTTTNLRTLSGLASKQGPSERKGALGQRGIRYS